MLTACLSAAPPARKTTDVAVGIIEAPDRRVLLAERPIGKAYAGYWEFPGGKIETGETVDAALARELHEELGVTIGTSRPWLTLEHDYPHAYVRLYFRRITGWQGQLARREGQRIGWHRPGDLSPQPLLPAAARMMRSLRLPERWRLPTTAIDPLVLVAEAGHEAADCRTPAQALCVDWTVATAPQATIARPPSRWCAAIVADAAALATANRVGFDFVVAAGGVATVDAAFRWRRLAPAIEDALAVDSPLVCYLPSAADGQLILAGAVPADGRGGQLDDDPSSSGIAVVPAIR